MATKLIRLENGTLVEVEAQQGEVEQISSLGAEQVHQSLDQIEPLLLNACRPVVAAWHVLNKELLIEQVEIELGLSFEAEGNLYISKFKGNASLLVKLVLKDRPQPHSPE